MSHPCINHVVILGMIASVEFLNEKQGWLSWKLVVNVYDERNPDRRAAQITCHGSQGQNENILRNASPADWVAVEGKLRDDWDTKKLIVQVRNLSVFSTPPFPIPGFESEVPL